MYLEDEYDNDYDYDSDLEDYEQRKVKKKSTSNENSKNKICDLFSLYGNMDQHKRAEILSKFCKASNGVLICTVNNFDVVFKIGIISFARTHYPLSIITIKNVLIKLI